MTRNHLSGGEASADQRGSDGTRAATVHPEFRESQKQYSTQEVEEAKEEARFWMQNPSISWANVLLTALEGSESENEKLRASLLEAVGALETFAIMANEDTAYLPDEHVVTLTYDDSELDDDLGGPNTLLGERFMRAFRRAAQVHARLSLEGGEGSGWLPIESAPKDGTWIQARIPGHGEDNIILWVADALEDGNGSCGAWAFALEDQEPPDCWSDGWCWAVNEDGVRSAWPTHWRLPPPPEHQAGGE